MKGEEGGGGRGRKFEGRGTGRWKTPKVTGCEAAAVSESNPLDTAGELGGTTGKRADFGSLRFASLALSRRIAVQECAMGSARLEGNIDGARALGTRGMRDDIYALLAGGQARKALSSRKPIGDKRSKAR